MIVEHVGFVRLAFAANDIDIVLWGIGESIDLGRESIGVDSLDDFVIHITATGVAKVVDVSPGKAVGIVPAE